jgi:hypothetical protein
MGGLLKCRPHPGPATRLWVYRHISQEVCPWNVRFAEVSAECDYAAREEWEAEWPVGDVSAETSDEAASSDDDDGPRLDSIIPGTDGPSLIALIALGPTRTPSACS